MAKCKNCKHLGYLSDGDQVGKRVWCEKITDSPDLDIERNCEHYGPMTTADRIRSMTDEELARFIVLNKFDCEDYCDDARWGCNCGCDKYDKVALAWLQKESEE